MSYARAKQGQQANGQSLLKSSRTSEQDCGHMYQEEEDLEFLSGRYEKPDSRVSKTFATAEFIQAVASPRDKAKAVSQRYASLQDDEEATGLAQAQNFVRSFMRTSSKASVRVLKPDAQSPAPSLAGDADTPRPSASPLNCQQDARSPRRFIAAHASFTQRPRRLDKTSCVSFSVRDDRGAPDEQQPVGSSWSPPDSPHGNRRAPEPSEPDEGLARETEAAAFAAGRSQLHSPRSVGYQPECPPQAAQRLRTKMSSVSFNAREEAGGDEDPARSPLRSARSVPRALSVMSSRVGPVDSQAEPQGWPAGSCSSQGQLEADGETQRLAKEFGSLRKVQSAVTADIEARKEKLGVYRSGGVPVNATWGVKSPFKPADVDPPTRRFLGKQASRPNLLAGLAEQPVDRAAGKPSELSVFCFQDVIDELNEGISPKVGTPFIRPPDLARIRSQDDPGSPVGPMDLGRGGSASSPRSYIGAVDVLRSASGPIDYEKACGSPGPSPAGIRRLLGSSQGALSPSPPAELIDSRGSGPSGAASPRKMLGRPRPRGVEVCLDGIDWMTRGAAPMSPSTHSESQLYLPPL